jgi:hypothetical protein
MKERILLAIDPTNVPFTLSLSRILKRFIIQKNQLSLSLTEIGILILKEEETQWFGFGCGNELTRIDTFCRASPGFIRDVKLLMSIIDQILALSDNSIKITSRFDPGSPRNSNIGLYAETCWDGTTLLSILKDCSLESADNNIVTRCILFFSRNRSIPKIDPNEITSFYKAHPLCIIDVLYIHEKASELNRVQEIYEILGGIENERSRSYEITKSQKRLLLATTELLGNPAFRSKEKDCHRWLLQ